MIQVLFFLYLNLLFLGIGLPLALLLPAGRVQGRPLVAPVLGYAVVAIGGLLAYTAGVPVRSIHLVAVVASLVGIARWGVRRASWSGVSPLVATTYGAASTVGLLPALVGGIQFTVFQGNRWDMFGYVETAAVFSRLPYRAVSGAAFEDILANPLLDTARTNLALRPAVHLLYAIAVQVLPAALPRLHYVFLVFLSLQMVLALGFLVMNVFRPVPGLQAVVLGAAFATGFWGQYVLDLNAWSQLSAMPLVAIAVALVALIFVDTPPAPSIGSGHATAIVLGVVLAALVYLYPESVLLHGPALVLAAGWTAYRTRRRDVWRLLTVAATIAVVIMLLHARELVTFGLAQGRWVAEFRADWERSFFTFAEGRGGQIPLVPVGVIEAPAGLAGLYLLTPGPGSTALFGLATGGLLAGFLALLGFAAISWLRMPSNAGVLVFKAHLVSLLGGAALLLLFDRHYAAGKGYTLASPYVMTALCSGIWGVATIRRWVSWILIAVQLALGAARVDAAVALDNSLYALPYPAGKSSWKSRFQWDLAPTVRKARACRLVLIQSQELWYERMALLSLFAASVPFVVDHPVRANFGFAGELGKPTLPFAPDCVLREVETTVKEGHGSVNRFVLERTGSVTPRPAAAPS